MIKKIALSAAIALGITAQSIATISISLQADLLQNNLGSAAPLSTLYMLVASTTDGDFSFINGLIDDGQHVINGGTSTAIGSLLSPSGDLTPDDFVLFRGNLTAAGTPGALDALVTGLNFANIPGWDAGDPLALIWFPSLTTSSTTIPNGTRYGIYTRNTSVPAEGSAAWITPANGVSNYPLGFFTQNGETFSPGPTAVNSAAAGRSTLTAVPEPSTLGMAALGIIGLMSRRRRN